MLPGLLVRLRPTGPWRIGPSSGARDRVDRIFHSDTLYSAVTHAMDSLGLLGDWLAATAWSEEPAVRFSSCFPFTGTTLLVVPPRHLWPPAAPGKLRWKGARFVPLPLIPQLLADQPLNEDDYVVDPNSQSLLPASRRDPVPGPFRVAMRGGAAVDRVHQGTNEHHLTACLEFAPNAGFWTAVAFADWPSADRWSEPLQAAFRLLADTGLGGERSLGWGHFETPIITEGEIPNLILPPAPDEAGERAYWLLSLLSPSARDTIDWSRGNYALLNRGGRVESKARWGDPKQTLRMVEEGSVLLAGSPPRGTARNVAPPDFPHPVFRAGFALAIPIPWKVAS